MKKNDFLKKISIAAFAVFTFSFSTAQNLIVNGSFTNNLNGWNGTNGPEHKTNGSNGFCGFNPMVSGNFVRITQLRGTISGHNYRLSYYAFGMESGGTYQAKVFNTGTGAGNLVQNILNNNTNTIDFSGTGGDITIEFIATENNPGGGQGYMNLDNVSLVDLTVLNVENTLALDKLKLYPNPANNNVNINFGTQLTNTKVSVINITGQQVLVKNIANSSDFTTLDTSSLAAGAYVISIASDQGIIRRRLIIK